jgi:uncharacterized membrane protein YvbJ
VQCKKCGTQIADKALICYKCGTATTDAKYQPVELRPKRTGPSALIVALAIAVVALLVLSAIYYFGLG